MHYDTHRMSSKVILAFASVLLTTTASVTSAQTPFDVTLQQTFESLSTHVQAVGARSAGATAVDVISARLSEHPRTVTTRIIDNRTKRFQYANGALQSQLAYGMKENPEFKKDAWTLWVEGAYLDFEGRPGFNDAYDAENFSVHVGLDWRKTYKGVLGVAFGRSQTKLNFNRLTTVFVPAPTATEPGRTVNPAREVTINLNAVYPYAQGRFSDQFTAWSVFGIGDGQVSVSHDTVDLVDFTSKLNYRMAAAGMKYLVNGSAKVFGFAVKSDVFVAELRASDLVSGGEDALREVFAGSSGRSDRFRIAAELSYNKLISERMVWLSSVDLVGRLDRGSAENGFGFEILADTKLRHLSSGFAVTGRANILVAHSDNDYESAGLNFGVSIDPNAAGYGLKLALNQHYGEEAESVGGVSGAIKHSDTFLNQNEEEALNPRWRTTMQASYGLSAGDFIATPFVEMDVNDSRNYTQIGARFSKASDRGGQLHMAFYGQSRYLAVADRVERGVFLALNWTP